MPTFRVYIRRPTTNPPIWDFSQTVVAADRHIALQNAYATWVSESHSTPPPPLSVCQYDVQERFTLSETYNIEDFPTIVLLDQMTSTYRNTQIGNFRPLSLITNSDDADDLFSLVQKSKKAPGSTNIAVVETEGPSSVDGKPTQNALDIYNDMLTLSSLANVVAMHQVYTSNPGGFDITNPSGASAFIRAQVVQLNDTFTRRLGAYALPGETTAHHYNKTMLSADLHLDFLTTLFASFNFPEKALTKLDSILNSVKDSLKNLKMKMESETETLDHMIFVNYIEAVDIEGIPEKVLVGKIRMFYLKINQKSWKAVVGKSSVSKITFTMDYFDTIFTINSNLVRNDISSIQELIKHFTGHNFEEMKKLTSPLTVTK